VDTVDVAIISPGIHVDDGSQAGVELKGLATENELSGSGANRPPRDIRPPGEHVTLKSGTGSSSEGSSSVAKAKLAGKVSSKQGVTNPAQTRTGKSGAKRRSNASSSSVVQTRGKAKVVRLNRLGQPRLRGSKSPFLPRPARDAPQADWDEWKIRVGKSPSPSSAPKGEDQSTLSADAHEQAIQSFSEEVIRLEDLETAVGRTPPPRNAAMPVESCSDIAITDLGNNTFPPPAPPERGVSLICDTAAGDVTPGSDFEATEVSTPEVSAIQLRPLNPMSPTDQLKSLSETKRRYEIERSIDTMTGVNVPIGENKPKSLIQFCKVWWYTNPSMVTGRYDWHTPFIMSYEGWYAMLALLCILALLLGAFVYLIHQGGKCGGLAEVRYCVTSLGPEWTIVWSFVFMLWLIAWWYRPVLYEYEPGANLHMNMTVFQCVKHGVNPDLYMAMQLKKSFSDKGSRDIQDLVYKIGNWIEDNQPSWDPETRYDQTTKVTSLMMSMNPFEEAVCIKMAGKRNLDGAWAINGLVKKGILPGRRPLKMPGAI